MAPMASFWCLYYQLWTYFTACSSVSIVNFEHAIAGWERAHNNPLVNKYWYVLNNTLIFDSPIMVFVIVLHFYDKASKALIIWLKVLQPKLMEPPKILNCFRVFMLYRLLTVSQKLLQYWHVQLQTTTPVKLFPLLQKIGMRLQLNETSSIWSLFKES